MKKTLFAFFLVFGCDSSDGVATDFRAALPPKAGLDLSVPGKDGGATGSGLATIGQIADLYAVTRQVSGQLNGLVGGVIHSIWDIAQNPPSFSDGVHAVWGPFTPPLSPVTYRLVGFPDHFELDARPKSAGDDAFQPAVTGVPGAFHVNLDLLNALDPVGNPMPGALQVAFDPSQIQVHLDGLDYRFTPGSFQFAANGQQIVSRWNDTGAGRADADGTITECWDSEFRRVFFTDGTNAEGSAQSCVF
jgi:hypothetical protein